MPEDRYMLMMLAHDDRPSGASFWAAANVDGQRVLTQEQVEAIAAQIPYRARFMFPYTEQSANFAGEHPPTLAIPPGQTLWQYGEPTRTDSLAVLKTLADGADSPEPLTVVLPVADVLRVAMERFGDADAHDVETHFDLLVADLEGSRKDEPLAYVVPIDRLLLSA